MLLNHGTMAPPLLKGRSKLGTQTTSPGRRLTLPNNSVAISSRACSPPAASEAASEFYHDIFWIRSPLPFPIPVSCARRTKGDLNDHLPLSLPCFPLSCSKIPAESKQETMSATQYPAHQQQGQPAPQGGQPQPQYRIVPQNHAGVTYTMPMVSPGIPRRVICLKRSEADELVAVERHSATDVCVSASRSTGPGARSAYRSTTHARRDATAWRSRDWRTDERGRRRASGASASAAASAAAAAASSSGTLWSRTPNSGSSNARTGSRATRDPDGFSHTRWTEDDDTRH